MDPKRISIVIPTCHRPPELLRRALRSALLSCGSMDEIVVVSDHDKTVNHTLSDVSDNRVRLIANNMRRGASATRNIGVESSQAHTVLFLDDDDELREGYVPLIIQALEQSQAKWGFSNKLQRMSAKGEPEPLLNKAFPRGFLGKSVPFRHKLAWSSAGFWARRELLLSIGGFWEDQWLDEDTEICCRLIASGIQPWFEPEPAMILDRDPALPRLSELNDGYDLERAAETRLRTFKRNHKALKNEFGAVSFLAVRAQRMMLRSGRKDLLNELLNEDISKNVRLLLWLKRAIEPFRIRQ